MFLLVLAHPGRPGQRAVKRSCVYVCSCYLSNINRAGGASQSLAGQRQTAAVPADALSADVPWQLAV